MGAPGTSPVQLNRTHRVLIGVVMIGVLVIAAIGFAGSYSAVRDLAERKGFGDFAPFFPIGIDAGIVVLLALDLLLTWLRIAFPLLRQTAWLLTAATIAFNGAAAWPDPLSVGMHAVIPLLFVVSVEAARHAVGRIADITVDKHMEGVRISRWLLAFPSTLLLWRRMKLWELRSYEEVIRLEQERLVYQAQLRARYGRAWRRKAPVESLMPLRLAKYGIPLAETGPAGLNAAGITLPVDTRHQRSAPAVVPTPATPRAVEEDAAGQGEPLAEIASPHPEPAMATTVPYGGGPPAVDYLNPAPAEDAPVPAMPVTDSAVPEPESSAGSMPEDHSPAVAEPVMAEPVMTESGMADSEVTTADEVADETPPSSAVPEPQSTTDDRYATEEQRLDAAVRWMDEAEAAGEKLSGAEIARRLSVSPRTGQRLKDKALTHRVQQARGHLRSVGHRS